MSYTPSDAGADLFEQLAPLSLGDEDRGSPLLVVTDAIASTLLQDIRDLAGDRGDLPGWAIIMDPANAPSSALAWLAQFSGVSVRPSWDDAETRIQISVPAGFQRGTPAAMRAAVQATLEGTKHVFIDERTGADAYTFAVATFDFETPDAAASERAAISQKPAGLILLYEALPGRTWDEVTAEGLTWSELMAERPTWTDVLAP